MIANGVESGIVNASGDLTAWGFQPNGNEWTIGIANPDSAHEIFHTSILPIRLLLHRAIMKSM